MKLLKSKDFCKVYISCESSFQVSSNMIMHSETSIVGFQSLTEECYL